MASALRQRLQPLLSTVGSAYGRRVVATPSRGFAHVAHNDYDEAKKWKGLTAIGLVVVLAYGIYTFTGEGHESHGERPAYSYLRIRNKEFPWGPNGLFEWHHHDD